MRFDFAAINGTTIAEVISDELLISDTQQALEIMVNCAYQGAECLILREHHLAPDFFDLKTKLAGNILQKFSTYQMRLAIVGNFEKFSSKSLRDFIFESNKGRRINFVESIEQARQVLSGN